MSGTDREMSPAEVAVLLGLVSHHDSRTDTSDAAVTTWRHALAGYSLGECQAAVIAHAHTSPDTLTPANLITRIRAARRTKGDREALRRNRLNAEENARAVATIHRGMAKVRAAMGWSAEPGATAEMEQTR
ncbi:hypothetical protein [Kutzneria sp. NPDC052558]|uniref:hypothetical protein n=1 Tax=Kutzneria sp. NPDC052558 TaxID=3364121 RepID=UPI0037C89AFA